MAKNAQKPSRRGAKGGTSIGGGAFIGEFTVFILGGEDNLRVGQYRNLQLKEVVFMDKCCSEKKFSFSYI